MPHSHRGAWSRLHWRPRFGDMFHRRRQALDSVLEVLHASQNHVARSYDLLHHDQISLLLDFRSRAVGGRKPRRRALREAEWIWQRAVGRYGRLCGVLVKETAI